MHFVRLFVWWGTGTYRYERPCRYTSQSLSLSVHLTTIRTRCAAADGPELPVKGRWGRCAHTGGAARVQGALVLECHLSFMK